MLSERAWLIDMPILGLCALFSASLSQL